LKTKNVVSKYLAHHAEPEVIGRPALHRQYQFVTCIPACDEYDTLPDTLGHLAQAQEAKNSLVIVVINARDDAPERVHKANKSCADILRKRAKLNDAPIAQGCFDGMGIVVVDRYSEHRRLPDRQGVGWARKIAVDLALAWINDRSINSRWIWSTDADVKVPSDYYVRPVTQDLSSSAQLFPFEHQYEGNEQQQQALRYYDAYLRYYVHGLAFHTIGSIMCLQADAYAKVRGFPKKLAGEDFYLLNKIAKVGTVKTLEGAPIKLSGRTSDRVPFGTGVAVAHIQNNIDQGHPYEVYDPQVFIGLKHWLSVIDIAAEAADMNEVEHALDGVEEPLGSLLKQAIQAQNNLAPIRRAIDEVTGDVRRKRLLDWFDAFKTLKLIHALRDAGLTNVPADHALTPFINPRSD
jgi:hypothetical protein